METPRMPKSGASWETSLICTCQTETTNNAQKQNMKLNIYKKIYCINCLNNKMHKKHNYKIIPSAQSTHSAADVFQVFKSSCKFKFS